MIRLKEGVSLRGCKSEILFALQVAEGVWTSKGAPELVVTCGSDGRHHRGSLHYLGQAVDLRTYNLPGGYRGQGAQEATEELQDRLGDEYDVVLEFNHVHIEFQPKGALNV